MGVIGVTVAEDFRSRSGYPLGVMLPRRGRVDDAASLQQQPGMHRDVPGLHCRSRGTLAESFWTRVKHAYVRLSIARPRAYLARKPRIPFSRTRHVITVIHV